MSLKRKRKLTILNFMTSQYTILPILPTLNSSFFFIFGSSEYNEIEQGPKTSSHNSLKNHMRMIHVEENKNRREGEIKHVHIWERDKKSFLEYFIQLKTHYY